MDEDVTIVFMDQVFKLHHAVSLFDKYIKNLSRERDFNTQIISLSK